MQAKLKIAALSIEHLSKKERKTGLGPATPTLARSCSTNWAISATSIFLRGNKLVKRRRLELPRRNWHYPLKVARLPIPPPLQQIIPDMLTKRVPRTGLEPARLAAHAPETCASTNSATWAFFEGGLPPTLSSFKMLSGKRDSDPRPRPWQGRALPTELFPPVFPHSRSIALDCGCKGTTFFRTTKIFLDFFTKKIILPITALTSLYLIYM